MKPEIEFNTRLELNFDGVPDRNLRKAMTDVGFLFDGRKMVWWLREKNTVYTPGKVAPVFVNGWDKALDLLVARFGVTLDECAKLSARRDGEAQCAADRGMEAACGII